MNVWKQFLASLIRYGIGILVGALVSRNIISPELSDKVLESAVGLTVVLLFAAAPPVWAFLKARFNLSAVETAILSSKSTTVAEVVAEVRKEDKTKLPV